MSVRYNRHFTVVALGTLATVGLFEGARGVLLPHFRTDLSLSATWAGAIFSAGALGYLANSLAFGTLSHRLGLKRMVAMGVGILALTMALFVALRAPLLLYLAAMVMGAGQSLIELSTSIHISLIYQEQQGGMLNLLHGFFGLGALSGSQWGALWLAAGFGWRVPYALVGAFILCWALYYLTLPRTELPREDAGQGAGVGPLLRDPLVWTAALALCAAVVGEAGATLWLPSYLQRVKGLAETVSAAHMTAFFVGFTGTRLAGSWLVERLGKVRSIVALAAVGLVSITAMLWLPEVPIVLPALCGAGVAIGFATCTALVATRYPDRVNQVYTVMYSAGGVAGIVTGPSMGWLGDHYGLAAAMWMPLVSYAVLIILMTGYGLAARPAEA